MLWESIVGGLLGKVAPKVADYYIQKVSLKHDLEMETLRGKIAWEAAKSHRASESEGRDAEWEMLALKNSGWKDEYVLIVLSIPMVLSFIPYTVVYVEEGFVALNGTPSWYQLLLITVFFATYGIRYWRRKQ